MRTEDFDYDLPQELIAQHPAEKRDYSRLMVLDKKTGAIEHKHFYEIIDYLIPGDVLVVNNTKVIPARLYGAKKDGTAQIEVLLLKETANKDEWEVLVHPGKRAKVGTEIIFGDGRLRAEVVQRGQRAARQLVETLPLGAQAKAAAAAFAQREAEPGFEGGELAADGGLAHAQQRLRGRHAAGVDDGQEDADQPQVEVGDVREHRVTTD